MFICAVYLSEIIDFLIFNQNNQLVDDIHASNFYNDQY